MTLPPDPFDGRISQDQAVEWKETLRFAVIDDTEPRPRRNRTILASLIATAIGIDTSPRRHQLIIEFHGNGAAVAADAQVDAWFGIACTILQWVVIAEQSTTCEVDVWVAPFDPDAAPDVGNTIVGAAPIAVAATLGATSADLGDEWTVDVPANSHMRFNVNSNDNAERLTIVLLVEET